MRTATYRSVVRRLVALATGGVVLLVPAAVTAQTAGPRAEQDTRGSRWIPSLSIQTGLAVDERDGETSSAAFGTLDGSSTQLIGFFGASLQLETPRLSFIPSKPRFFARADVMYSLDKKESLVSEGVPDDPINKIGEGFNMEAGSVEQNRGRGVALRPQVEPLILGAGVGLSFEAEVFGRDLRIKPSIEWMYQQDEVAYAFSDVVGNGADPDRCQPECRAVSIQLQDTKGYHSLGPGFELDYDAGRAGEFKVSVFSRFQALSILGDRSIRLTGSGTWYTRDVERINGRNVITSIDPAGVPDATVYSRYTREPWSYVATAGVRIFWDPR